MAGVPPGDPGGHPHAAGIAAQVYNQTLLDTIIAASMLNAPETSFASVPVLRQPNVAAPRDHALTTHDTASRQQANMRINHAEGMQADTGKLKPLQLELQQWSLSKKVVQVRLVDSCRNIPLIAMV